MANESVFNDGKYGYRAKKVFRIYWAWKKPTKKKLRKCRRISQRVVFLHKGNFLVLIFRKFCDLVYVKRAIMFARNSLALGPAPSSRDANNSKEDYYYNYYSYAAQRMHSNRKLWENVLYTAAQLASCFMCDRNCTNTKVSVKYRQSFSQSNDGEKNYR